MLCIILGTGLLAGGIYYINQSGINDQWRERIALELENLGIVADFESLRFEITRGLVAKGVRVYADDNRQDVVATLEHLVIDVDKTKLMRGKVRVNNVSLKKADISIAIDPEQLDGPRIIISDLRGDMFLPDKRTLEARELEGLVAGIQISMNARIWSERVGEPKDAPDLKEKRIARLKFISHIIEEIAQWQWPEDKPPQLELYLEGNVDNPDNTRLDFIFNASELKRRGATLYNVSIKGDYDNHIITLDSISLKDGVGSLNAKAAYRPALRSGRFEANSTLHLQMLSRRLFDANIMSELTFSTAPAITCTGKVSFDKKYTPSTSITGNALIRDFSFLGSRFKQLKTDFSHEGRDLFLTGLHAIHDDGELKGRILLKNEIVRYQADSTLPPSAYTPFLADSGIDRAMSQARFSASTKLTIQTEGTMNRSNLTQWEAEGFAKIENFTYKDTPLHSLSGEYSLSALYAKFTDIRADFDYNDYTLRRKHGGPSSAHVSASSITIDQEQKAVNLDKINGTAWPAPIVRLFVPRIADHVEKYRFHRPPSLSASGVFDLQTTREKTDFMIKLSSPGSMNYDFIGEPLTMSRLKADVRILGDRVDVDKLSFYSFQGACNGNISVRTAGQDNSSFSGDMQFRRLHLKDMGELYEFDNAERGLLTGRIDFSGQGDEMRKFNGKGSLALEKGNLFSVPMLGPISQLIGNVLGDRNPTEEKANDASCTYVIRDGIAYSNNFLATTRSLKFTGEGKIDLDKKEIDFLMRMNARGLFGFIALPLRPFMGLFQFKGTGSISKPIWATTLFTTPSGGKNDPIFRKPPKAKVLAE